MIGLEIQIQLLKGKRKEFLHAFEFLSPESPECIGQILYEDVNKDNRFLWALRWTNLKSLEDHICSDQFKSILGAIEILGELGDLEIIEYKLPPENLC
jgi:quinol monooxygenase YgiN